MSGAVTGSPDASPRRRRPRPGARGGSSGGGGQKLGQAGENPSGWPGYASAFVGRRRELAEARAVLARPDVRLLTLTGPPGVGKTRLAVEVAKAASHAFPDGVRFVDLSSVPDPGKVLGVVARSLGVASGGSDPLEPLVHAVGDRRMLLVLDNFEHVLEAAVGVSTLLDRAPGVKVLATSREALRLRWEHVLCLEPLPVPGPGSVSNLRRLAQVPAVALLLQAVRHVNPGFRLTQANAEAVARICVHLDGLPLALELAAPSFKSLGVETVVGRLDHRLSMLSRAARDLPPRHRTLRAAVGWSYGMLAPAEQAAFRRLGVLPGGWTVEAAAAVCGMSAGVAVDVLSRLVDKSLVLRGDPTGTRFRMLETLRAFATEQLLLTGELVEVQQRAARYFADLAEGAHDAFHGPHQQEWMDRLEHEYGNLQAALQWCCEAQDAHTLCRLAASLWPLWNVRGYWQEGRRWVSAALVQAGDLPALGRARLLHALAVLTWRLGEYEAAAAAAQEAWEEARSAGDLALSAHALRTAAVVARDRADIAEARRLADRSLQLFREIHDTHGVSCALRLVGFAALEWCDVDEAAKPFADSLPLARQLGDSRGVAWSLYGLAAVAVAACPEAAGSTAPEVSRAETLGGECLRLFSDLGDRNGVAQALTLLARVEVIRGDYARAEERYREALTIRRGLGNPADLASLLVELAVLAEVRGDDGGAARLFREALEQFGHGAHPVSLAHAAEGLAILASRLRHPRTVARLLGFAGSLYQSTGVAQAHVRTPGMPRLEQVREAEQEARKALGQEGYAQMWAEGAAMPLEALTAEASALVPTVRPGSGAGGLTPREQEVAALVARGLSNRQIAARLGVSERTVDSHVIHILNRLGFRSRTQIAVWAAEHRASDASAR